MPQSLENDIQRLVRLAGNVTDAFTAALFLLDEGSEDTLTLRACQSLSGNIVTGARIPLGRGLVGWAAKNERSAHATNFDRDTTTLQYYSKDEDIKSFAAAPLFDGGGRVMGVLAVDSKKSYVFTDKALKILEEFAGVISRAVTEGRKRISLDARASAFDALSGLVGRITACSRFSEITDALRLALPSLIPHDKMVMAVRMSDDGKYYMVRSGAGQTPGTELPGAPYRLGWVIQQARTIYVPDLKGAKVAPGADEQWRSFIGAPMAMGDHVSGAIGLVSRKQAAFSHVSVKSLSVLASTLASAFTSLYLHNRNMRAVFTDPLTSAATSRYLVETHQTLEGKGAVAIVNLIGFTRINHELGMDAGDRVTIETARRLSEVVAERGIVCRYYGDRFILLLRGLEGGQAMAMAQAVVDSVESLPYHLDGVDIYASPSIGVALYPADGNRVEELIAKAQVASEKAKSASGSRVSFYSEQEASWGGALGAPGDR
ncbi:MAG: GAF domain-containing protein [Candidatus Nitrospinota bacterium M3_3B_026]